jgi:hypothetical protein
MIEWLGKLVSIVLHLLIPEFLRIPFYLAIPEFRAELDDRMAR